MMRGSGRLLNINNEGWIDRPTPPPFPPGHAPVKGWDPTIEIHAAQVLVVEVRQLVCWWGQGVHGRPYMYRWWWWGGRFTRTSSTAFTYPPHLHTSPVPLTCLISTPHWTPHAPPCLTGNPHLPTSPVPVTCPPHLPHLPTSSRHLTSLPHRQPAASPAHLTCRPHVPSHGTHPTSPHTCPHHLFPSLHGYLMFR